MPAVAQRQLKFICGSGHLARATYAMIATGYPDNHAGPAATTGTMPARAETLTGASSGSTASNRADGPDACSRPHDHQHVDGIIPNHPGASSGSTASNCADGPDACSISVFVTTLAFATLAALATYLQAHSQGLAVVTGTVAYLVCMQMYREGADGVIDGLRWTFNKCAGGLVAAARWAFNTAVVHTQFAVRHHNASPRPHRDVGRHGGNKRHGARGADRAYS